MVKVFALQGSWAVGKSTFVRNCLDRRKSHKTYVGEFGVKSRAIRNEHGFDLSTRDGFLRNQQLFFREAYETSQMFLRDGIEVAILDRGFEDVLCFSQIHQAVIGVDWEIHDEICELEEKYPFFRSERTAFLTAELKTLFSRRRGDSTKSREKFEEYIERYYDLEVAYYSSDSNCAFIDTSNIGPEDVFLSVREYFGISNRFKSQ